MIKLVSTVDPYEIKSCLLKDNLHKRIIQMDNFEESWMPDVHSTSWICIYKDEVLVGIIAFRTWLNNTMTFHGGVFKAHRGDSVKILKHCLDKAREATKANFVTTILEGNAPAIRLVKKLGFKQQMKIKDGYKQGNALVFGEE